MGNLLVHRSNKSEEREKDSIKEEETDWPSNSWNSEYSAPTDTSLPKRLTTDKISTKQNTKALKACPLDHSSSFANKIRLGFKSKKSRKRSPKKNAKRQPVSIAVKETDEISHVSESPDSSICPVTDSAVECLAASEQIQKQDPVVNSKTSYGAAAQPAHRVDKFRSLIPRLLRRNKAGNNDATDEENGASCHSPESKIPAFHVSSSFYPERKSKANTKQDLLSKYSLNTMHNDALKHINSSDRVIQNDELYNMDSGSEKTATEIDSMTEEQVFDKKKLSMNWSQEIKSDKIQDGVFRFTGEDEIIESQGPTTPLFNAKLVPSTKAEFKNNTPISSPKRHNIAYNNFATTVQKDLTNTEYRTVSPLNEKNNCPKIENPVTKKDECDKEGLTSISSDTKNHKPAVHGINSSLANSVKPKTNSHKPGECFGSPETNHTLRYNIENTKVFVQQSPHRHDGHLTGKHSPPLNGDVRPGNDKSPFHGVPKEQQIQIVQEQKNIRYQNGASADFITNTTPTQTCVNSKTNTAVLNTSHATGGCSSAETTGSMENTRSPDSDHPEVVDNHQPTDNPATPDTKSQKHPDDKKQTNSNDKSKRKKRQSKGKKKKQKKGNRWTGPKEFSKIPEEASAYLERYLTEDKTLKSLEKYSRFMAFHWRSVRKVNAITAIVLMATHSKKWKNVDELEVVQSRMFSFVGKVELKDEDLVDYLNKYYQPKRRLTDEEITERDEQKKVFEKELEDLAIEAADMDKYCAEILDRPDVQLILDCFMHRVRVIHGAECQCGMKKFNLRKTKTNEPSATNEESDNELWDWLEDMMKRGNRPDHMKAEDIPSMQPSGDSKKTGVDQFAEELLDGDGFEINIDHLSAEVKELITEIFPEGEHLMDAPQKLPVSLLKQLAVAFRSKDEDQIRHALEAYIIHLSEMHDKLKEEKNAENLSADGTVVWTIKTDQGQGLQQKPYESGPVRKDQIKESPVKSSCLSPPPYSAFEVAGHVDDYMTRGTKGKKGRPVEIKKKEKTRNGKKKNTQNPAEQDANINI